MKTPQARAAWGYHARTRHHHPNRYARALGYLDWATQPNPHRVFEGADKIPLPRREPDGGPAFDALYTPQAQPPAALDLEGLGQLLYDALALSAWKRSGASKWALRCNPSSGNLHPTEAYVITAGREGLAPGVYHYSALLHALELRRRLDAGVLDAGGGLWVALTSIHGRESWKYGERAYRYCQHDVGHALAALAFSASALGWRVHLRGELGDEGLARLLGLDEEVGHMRERPDLLLWIGPAEATPPRLTLEGTLGAPIEGRANPLSADHLAWPVIDEVAEACAAGPVAFEAPPWPALEAPEARGGPSGRVILRQRRSAVDMDAASGMSTADFERILARLSAPELLRAALPWAPIIEPVFFIHRVEGYAPGRYLLDRQAGRLGLLAEGDLRGDARASMCHQAIASDGAFAVALCARLEPLLEARGAPAYRYAHWEAGALGQILYLEAEAAGLRGTGIGCFFDEALRVVSGDPDRTPIYCFTIGGPLDDPRIQALPAYHHLDGIPTTPSNT